MPETIAPPAPPPAPAPQPTVEIRATDPKPAAEPRMTFAEAAAASAFKKPDTAPAPAEPVAPAPAAPAPADAKPPVTPTPAIGDDIIPDDAFAAPGDKKPVPDDLATKTYDAPDSIKSDPVKYENWNELHRGEERAKRTAAQFEQENTELRKKVESYKTDEGLKIRLTELEKANVELSERAAQGDLRSRPEWKNNYLVPRANVVKSIVDLCGTQGADVSEVEKALNQPTPEARRAAMEPILKDLGSIAVSAEIGAGMTRINDLDGQANAALANAQETMKALSERQAAEQSKFMENYNKEVSNGVDSLVDFFANKRNIAFFRPIEGNEAWNARRAGYVTEAKRVLLESTDPKEHSAAVVMGMAYPDTYNALVSTRTKLGAALKRIAELEGADPDLSSKVPTPTPAQDKLSFAEAAARSSGLP